VAKPTVADLLKDLESEFDSNAEEGDEKIKANVDAGH
jgi:hypothetical protein